MATKKPVDKSLYPGAFGYDDIEPSTFPMDAFEVDKDNVKHPLLRMKNEWTFKGPLGFFDSVTLAADTTLTAEQFSGVFSVVTNGGQVTVTLPDAQYCLGKMGVFTVVSGGNNFILDGHSTQRIIADGSSTQTFTVGSTTLDFVFIIGITPGLWLVLSNYNAP